MLQNLSSAAVVIGSLRVNSLLPGNFFLAFSPSDEFIFEINFLKVISGIPSECQAVWFQTVC